MLYFDISEVTCMTGWIEIKINKYIPNTTGDTH